MTNTPTALRRRLLGSTLALSLLSLLSLLAPLSVSAQLADATANPVRMGHLHLNVSDLDSSKTFWIDQLGGRSERLGPLEMVVFPNVLVVLAHQAPSAGSFGSSVNHVGLQVPDVQALVTALEAGGARIVTEEQIPQATGPVFDLPQQETRVAFVESPSGVRVELFENRVLMRLENHHLHYFTSDPEATRDWYVERFGATPRIRGTFLSADLPGVNLTFSAGESAPTKGRALDHVGFEVDDLDAVVSRLEADGLLFDRPIVRVDALGLAFAFFTDPWGTYVELTEGLDRF